MTTLVILQRVSGHEIARTTYGSRRPAAARLERARQANHAGYLVHRGRIEAVVPCRAFGDWTETATPHNAP